MSQRKLSVEVNKFNKGLVGSASPVDFPIDAASTLKNFVIEKDGSLRKRAGLSTKHSFSLTSTDSIPIKPDGASNLLGYVSNFRSKNDLLLLVLEIRNVYAGVSNDIIRFVEYDITSNSSREIGVATSSGAEPRFPYNNGVTGSAIDLGGAFTVTSSEQCYTLYYDSALDKIAYDPDIADIRIRDSWGVSYEEGAPGAAALANATLYPKLVYNAYNNGYGGADVVKLNATDDGRFVPGKLYSAGLTFQSKNSGPVLSNNHYLQNQEFFTEIVPRGKWIGSPYNWKRLSVKSSGSAVVSVDNGLALSTTLYTDSILSNGRVWHWAKNYEHSGNALDRNTPNPDTMILFSQVVIGGEGASKCYSANDPTACGDIPAQPLEADGGVIVISGSGAILQLIDYDGRIIVFAENGVWEISGPFSPINYQIRKLTDERLSDHRTVVFIDDRVVFMGEGAIMAIVRDPRYNTLSATDISSPSLADMYLQRYKVTRDTAIAFSAYNGVDGVVEWWMCKDVSTPVSGGVYTVLCYDKVLGVFYSKEYVIPESAGNFRFIGTVEDFTTPGKFLLIGLHKASVGSSATVSIVDPEAGDLIDTITTSEGQVELPYSAELETGAASFGDASKAKNAPYISLYFKQTEGAYNELGDFDTPSSCLMRLKWDFSRSADTGKWTDEREMYRLNRFNYPDTASFDYGYDVVVTKNKVRGRGKALRIKLTIPSGKTCHLYGWNFTLLTNSEV